MILTGDVNLMNVDEPLVPFARVHDRVPGRRYRVQQPRMLPVPAAANGHAVENEGFFASPDHRAAKRCERPASPRSAWPTT